MKSRPILFSAPMVRALLDGSKTQTRRVVKGSDAWPINTHHATMLETRGTAMAVDAMRCTYGPEIKCPHGKTGDSLWVRETFCEVPMTNLASGKTSIFIEFAAGKSKEFCDNTLRKVLLEPQVKPIALYPAPSMSVQKQTVTAVIPKPSAAPPSAKNKKRGCVIS